MRPTRTATVLAPLSLLVLAAACGDKAGLPNPLADNQRAYGVASCDPIPEQTGIEPTFAQLYASFFSLGGAAQCQNGACHGRLDDTGTPVGQSGLAMSSASFREESPGTPFGNPAGVYCGLTKHVFGGRPVVNADPKHHDYVVATDAVVPEGTQACCEVGDLLYKATDCTGGTEAKTTDVGGAKGNQSCAVATNTGTCARALCRTDAILKVLDRSNDASNTRPAANDGFMPNRLPCNRTLTAAELDVIFQWLLAGAKYDGFTDPAAVTPTCTSDGLVCGDGLRPCD